MAKITAVCFWCQQDTGETREVKEGGDRRSVVTYEPCGNCKKKFGEGTTFVEVSFVPYAKEQPPIIKREPFVYPSGAYAVVGEEDVRQAFTEDKAKEMIEAKTVLIDTETYQRVFSDPGEDETAPPASH